MGKRILIGSMLVLAMLLLMPSIPAIQQKTIDVRLDTRESELLTKFQDLDIGKIKDLLNEKSLGYTPLFLTLLIYAIFISRIERGFFIFSYSTEAGEWGAPIFIHPILAIRGFWLILTAIQWIWFWIEIYAFMGWDSPFPE